MAEILLVVCAMSCCSSSVGGVGAFITGFIPRTEPHLLRVTEADKMKKIVEEFVEQDEKKKDQLSSFPDPGPDLSILSDEQRVEYTDIVRQFADDLRDGDLCKTVKDLTDEYGNFIGKKVLKEYADTVYTLDGTKSKDDVFNEYVGIGDQLSKGEIDEYSRICTASDEEYEAMLLT
jgi:predicted PolB exonuclease-like 3'-5' exonuclease